FIVKRYTIYTISNKKIINMFLCNDSKNETLIDTRGISFDEIVSAIELDINPLDIYENKNYKNQYKIDVLIGDYV
ncbi:hypothetical protein, partial [Francisella noatunensis]